MNGEIGINSSHIMNKKILVSAKSFYCQRNGFQSLIICDNELYFPKVSP